MTNLIKRQFLFNSGICRSSVPFLRWMNDSEIKKKNAEIDETVILWRKQQNRIWFTRTFGCLSRQPNNNGVHCCIVNPTAGLFRLFRNRRYTGIVRGLPGEKQKTSLSEKWSSPSRPWMLSSAYDTLVVAIRNEAEPFVRNTSTEHTYAIWIVQHYRIPLVHTGWLLLLNDEIPRSGCFVIVSDFCQ